MRRRLFAGQNADRQVGAPVAKKTDLYRLMICGGCKRTIDTRAYWGFPQADADPSRVHLIPDAAAPAYGIHCTCGHYTLYVSPENLPVGLPKGVRTPWVRE